MEELEVAPAKKWTEAEDAALREAMRYATESIPGRTAPEIAKRMAALFPSEAAPSVGGSRWTPEEEGVAREFYASESQNIDEFWALKFGGKRSKAAVKTYIESYIAPLCGRATDVPAAVRTLKAKLQGMTRSDAERGNVSEYLCRVADFLISDDPVVSKRRKRAPEPAWEGAKAEDGDTSVFL